MVQKYSLQFTYIQDITISVSHMNPELSQHSWCQWANGSSNIHLFGLSQAPAYFQLLIDKVLMGCSSFAMGYLDDIIIFSKSEEEHLQHLEEIFTQLRKFGLKMKREKCSFFKIHIQYLGHLVSERGFEPLPGKLESIKNMPAPRTAKEVKQFLGLIGSYRKFVPHFVDISRP